MDQEVSYKNFIRLLRNAELETAYIVINENVSTKLYEYVSSLNDLCLVQNHHHVYCNDINLIINHFIQFWMTVMHNTTEEADILIHTITKPQLINLIDKSINTHISREIMFIKEFTVESTEDRIVYDEVETKFRAFMQDMRDMRLKVQLFNKDLYVVNFAIDQFAVSVNRKAKLLEITHTNIALALAAHIENIKLSLDECLRRVVKNLKLLQEERETMISSLLDNLYDMNKELTMLSRVEKRHSLETAEVDYKIKKLRQRIEEYQNTTPVPRLENEKKYWETRLGEFNIIYNTIGKLKLAWDDIQKKEKIYNSLKCIETAGSKKWERFENIDISINEHKEFISQKYIDIARTCVTFFGVRGLNRIIYVDNVGQYSVDEYGHQTYIFDYGKNICHVTCDGSFREVPADDNCHFDNHGRYVLDEEGNRIYQIAPCTSTYRLNDDDTFHKTTVDCGHSSQVNFNCKMQLRDPTRILILLPIKPQEKAFAHTQKPEDMDFVRNVFGHILPEELNKIAMLNSQNPVFTLAHNLLDSAYSMTHAEIRKKREEVRKYRLEIHNARNEKLKEQALEWRKHVKGEKGGLLDNAFERAALKSTRDTTKKLTSQLFYYNY